jgi:hypothetical protein
MCGHEKGLARLQRRQMETYSFCRRLFTIVGVCYDISKYVSVLGYLQYDIISLDMIDYDRVYLHISRQDRISPDMLCRL